MNPLPRLVVLSLLSGLSLLVLLSFGGGRIPQHSAANLAERRVEVVQSKTCADGVAGGHFALTFDDGPHPVNTPAILDWLKENKLKATFFLLGENAVRYPELVARIAAEGHELGNHTWTHTQLTKLKPEAVRREVKRTHELIVSLTGRAPVYFRPPYGSLLPTQRMAIEKEFGYRTVLWDADSLDWKLKSEEAVVKELHPFIRKGAIVLAHDIHPRILPALRKLLPEAAQRGLTPAPLSRVLPMESIVAAKKAYSRGELALAPIPSKIW